MLSIDAKFAAIIITHASAATYGPMLSSLSPLSSVSFQLDEDVFQELVDLWATVSAIIFSQIFCNDCSMYSVVWNGISLPFFLGYQIVHGLLFITTATVIRAFSHFYSVITEFCAMGESTFDSTDFDYRETSSNGAANTIHLLGFPSFRYLRNAKVESALNVPILIDYAETECCEAYTSSDLIPNRIPLAISHGRTTSHATEIADPYDISFGIFFDVAERGLLLQQEFLLLANCIVAILSYDICSTHEPICSVDSISDDHISNRVPLTISHGRTTSHVSEIADPYDISFGIFFDVAECGLSLQQEFFLLANCIVTIISDDICSFHEPAIVDAPKEKRVRFAEGVSTIPYYTGDAVSTIANHDSDLPQSSASNAPVEPDFEVFTDEEAWESFFREPEKPPKKGPVKIGYNIFGNAEKLGEDDPDHPDDDDRYLQVYCEAMSDSYKILSRDLGQLKDMPIATNSDEKILYNITVVKSLLESIVSFSDQLSACRGARAENFIERSKRALGRDPIRWMLYYCYDVGIRAVESHKSTGLSETKETMCCQYETALQMSINEETGEKESLLMKEMFETYISYTSRAASDCADYKEKCEKFQEDMSEAIRMARFGKSSIQAWISYLDYVALTIRGDGTYKYLIVLRAVRAYYSLKTWFEEQKSSLAPSIEREDNFCALVKYAERRFHGQHWYHVHRVNQFSVWNEKQFLQDYSYYKQSWESNLPKHKVMFNSLCRNVTGLFKKN